MNVATQCDQILTHLRTGKHLTALEALQRFQCLRLAARIGDLRKEGHEITSTRIELPNGKRVASYRIPNDMQLAGRGASPSETAFGLKSLE